MQWMHTAILWIEYMQKRSTISEDVYNHTIKNVKRSMAKKSLKTFIAWKLPSTQCAKLQEEINNYGFMELRFGSDLAPS